jgi:Zn-dependent peptidase ImmA (M78 family)
MGKMTGKEIGEKVAAVINRIANSLDAASFGSMMKEHFTSVSYLANLSWNNQMLAILQGATGEVRTFNQWKAVGRMVRKGEHSHITLIRPNFGKKKNAKDGEDDTFVWFSGYPVFDISQTMSRAEMLPVSPFDSLVTAVEKKLAEQNKPSETVYFDMLIGACNTLGIEYRESLMPKGLYGTSARYAPEIALASNLVTARKVGVLAHELAHQVLHRDLPEDVRQAMGGTKVVEYQAEMTAAVIMDYFGLDNDFSAAYVKMYGADVEKLTATMKAVQKAVSVILKAMDQKEEEEEGQVAA